MIEVYDRHLFRTRPKLSDERPTSIELIEERRKLITWKVVKSKNARFTNDSVEVTGKSRTQQENWSEPLANYACIRYRQATVERAEVHHTIDILELEHADAAKTIPIWVDGRPKHLEQGSHSYWEPRAEMERYAKMFNLPLKVGQDDYETVRSVADLDTTLSAQGEVSTRTSTSAQNLGKPTSTPPEGLKHTAKSDAITITLLRRRRSMSVYYFWGALGIIFFALPGLIWGDLIGLSAGLGIAGYTYFSFAKDANNLRRLEISPSQVLWHCGVGKDLTINRKDIEEVRRLSADSVLIGADTGSITVNGGLTEDDINWLEAFLLQELSGKV